MHIFIDTNIFLSFYHLTSDDLEELRKLGVLLDEKHVVLYLTDQVAAEFRRNRENKIAEALKGLKEQRLNLHFPQVCKDYPEYGDLRELQSQYEQAHSTLIKKLADDVAATKLKADMTIQELFAKATLLEATDATLARARLRVQIGNPPGKDDSFGDAVNWELLMEKGTEGKDLQVITDDRDYISVLDENRLKEFLVEEWEDRKKSKVLFHRRLSSFFKSHFPQINLASDLERELAIRALAASASFATTHACVARLSKYTQFTAA
jgi:predicted nucleic acid-binding protein